MVLSSSKVGVQFIYKDFLVNPQISKYTTKNYDTNET